MTSLKAYLPALADVLGITADALYTRQRALVERGVLESVPGRGPGSGTPGNAFTVAGLLIAVLTADTLQDTDDRVKAMCEARRNPRPSFTAYIHDFQGAVADAINDAPHDLVSIIVARHESSAEITFDRREGYRSHLYVAQTKKLLKKRSAISLRAEIGADTVRKIKKVLRGR